MTNTKIERIEMDSSVKGSEEQTAIIVYDDSSGKYVLDPTSKMEAGRERETLGKEQTAIGDAAADEDAARYASPTLIELRITKQGQQSDYTMKRDDVRDNYYGGPWYFSSGRLTKTEAQEVCDIIQQVRNDLLP